MKVKKEAAHARFTAGFAPEVIDKWTAMVEAWDSDPQKPNPYEEVGKGSFSWLSICHLLLLFVLASTMAQVRHELAEEELVKARQGVGPIHDVSPNKFLQAGLELEEQQ
jgi:hypothetical protein